MNKKTAIHKKEKKYLLFSKYLGRTKEIKAYEKKTWATRVEKE
jgi:hypothetical protein